MNDRGVKAAANKNTRPTSERRARKAAALRQRLIDCALKQFEKHGFTRTSIDAITEAADVGKGTFYNYFDSKESLLAEWGRQILLQGQKEIAESQGENEPALRKLFRLFTILSTPLERRPRLSSSYIVAHLLLAPDTPAVHVPKKLESDGETPPANILELTLPIIRQAIQQKAIRADLPPERIAQTLVGVFYQSILLHATGENNDLPQEALRSSLAIALEGLAPIVE